MLDKVYAAVKRKLASGVKKLMFDRALEVVERGGALRARRGSGVAAFAALAPRGGGGEGGGGAGGGGDGGGGDGGGGGDL